MSLVHPTLSHSAPLSPFFFTLHPKYFTNLGQRRRGLFCHTLKFNCCLTAVFNITQIFKYNLKFAPKEGAYLVCKICVYNVLCPCEHSSAKEFLRVTVPGAPHKPSNTCFLLAPSSFSAVSKGREVGVCIKKKKKSCCVFPSLPRWWEL